ncbi:hypothetical protein K4L06_08475 [Lysobacter sp. BMK333-48F3]|uniref:hypothetical protein n=1 Tax=Lysobacter sp. BMK333-48F3 TaxID=2867962 RepID=UPI001C8B7162|nr:hypothetical protein [Lysobacter sp. BMK333-48F3]MBX9401349.1 hypothetical protein [Lysobacter sp. BMK333-48F3]
MPTHADADSPVRSDGPVAASALLALRSHGPSRTERATLAGSSASATLRSDDGDKPFTARDIRDQSRERTHCVHIADRENISKTCRFDDKTHP